MVTAVTGFTVFTLGVATRNHGKRHAHALLQRYSLLSLCLSCQLCFYSADRSSSIFRTILLKLCSGDERVTVHTDMCSGDERVTVHTDMDVSQPTMYVSMDWEFNSMTP